MKIDVTMLERMNVDDFMEKYGLSLSITEQSDLGFLIKIEGIKRNPSFYPIGVIHTTNIIRGMSVLFRDFSTRTIFLEANPNDPIKVPVLTWTKSQIDNWGRLV